MTRHLVEIKNPIDIDAEFMNFFWLSPLSFSPKNNCFEIPQIWMVRSASGAPEEKALNHEFIVK